MSFQPDALLADLAQHEAMAGRPARFIIAFSGGADSTALLIALAETRDRHRIELVAVHVNHQLQNEADRWADQCAQVATSLGVVHHEETVRIDPDDGSGPEAAARSARYSALAAYVGDGDWLLTAHHREDQAETLLLQALRGSGVAGLAGMPACRTFARGFLVRPLLDVARGDLVAFVADHGVPYVDDPSNAESRFDRNFLRNDILPVLETRWQDARKRLAKTAAHAQEAVELLEALADIDIDAAGGKPAQIDLATFRQLSRARQKNLLRRASQRNSLPPLPAAQLERIVDEVVPARDDAEPLVTWAGAEARRYRNRLYLQMAPSACDFDGSTLPLEGVALGAGMGRLALEPGAQQGLTEALVDAGLTLRCRRGGEEIRPLGQQHTRKLKKLLQEEGVLPWWRDRLPLVYSGDRLVAVADLWLAADAAVPGGTAVRWHERPVVV